VVGWPEGPFIACVRTLAQMLEYYEFAGGPQDGADAKQQDELRKAGHSSPTEGGPSPCLITWPQVRGNAPSGLRILEVSSSLRGMGPRDPYALPARTFPSSAYSAGRVVDDEAPKEKYRSRARLVFGCWRPSGFRREASAPSGGIHRDPENDEVVGGGSIKDSIPLGVRVREGRTVECALPDESGAPN